MKQDGIHEGAEMTKRLPHKGCGAYEVKAGGLVCQCGFTNYVKLIEQGYRVSVDARMQKMLTKHFQTLRLLIAEDVARMTSD
jgi:hypothetical protein